MMEGWLSRLRRNLSGGQPISAETTEQNQRINAPPQTPRQATPQNAGNIGSSIIYRNENNVSGQPNTGVRYFAPEQARYQNVGNVPKQQARPQNAGVRVFERNELNAAQRQTGHQNVGNVARPQNAGVRGFERNELNAAQRQTGQQNVGNVPKQQARPQNAGVRGFERNERNAAQRQTGQQNVGNVAKQQARPQNAGVRGFERNERNAAQRQTGQQNVGNVAKQQVRPQNAGVRRFERNELNAAQRQTRPQNAGNVVRRIVDQNENNVRLQYRPRNAGQAERRITDRNEDNFGQQQRPRNGSNAGQQWQGRQGGDNAEETPQERAPQDNQQNNASRMRDHNKIMGFRCLEEIANSNSNDIITSIGSNREKFINLLNSCADKPDVFVLVIKIISELSKSPLENQKNKLIPEICNTLFLDSYLMKYLMDLPYASKKGLNKFYWQNPDEFWLNFITTFDCIITILPSLALHKYRSLIEAGTRSCLDGLKSRHNYTLPEHFTEMLENLKALFEVEIENEEKKKTVKRRVLHDDEPPPDDFRELSVIPGKEELLIDVHPYVRANLVNGGYIDVEHYLDVQFRLLREDCFAPLRQGIAQYMESPKRKEHESKYDNIRVFHNVKFLHTYMSQNKVGSVLEISQKDKQRFSKIKWNYSKRFIYGSLLLLTKDNFKTCITVTVLDRNINLIAKGMIPVTVYGLEGVHNLYNDDLYTMVESEVYFEPYYHVLRALQDNNFPEQLSMQQYIVQANMTPLPPAYVTEITTYTTNSVPKYEFEVLSHHWPSAYQLGYDDSQYEAYKLALTHEFAIIQGPPGTGKTFIGVEIAKTLLNNLKDVKGPLMLVICYTNHALDQFLEAILNITPSVVRIGSQSKNEAMEKINILNLRRTVSHKKFKGNKLLYENKHAMKCEMKKLLNFQTVLQTINEGIVSRHSLIKAAPEVEYIANYFKDGDPVVSWLFSGVHQFMSGDTIEEDDDDTANELEAVNIFEEDDVARTDVILDKFDEEDIQIEEISNIDNINLAFSVHKTQNYIKDLRNQCKTVTNNETKEEMREMMKYSYAQLRMFDEMMKLKCKKAPAMLINEWTDVTAIPLKQRWQIYFKWISDLEASIERGMKPLLDNFQKVQEDYEEARILIDLELLQDTRVIGMTTSAAARLRKLLQSLKIPIIIVEEAAEVLEQHIVTSLTAGCQHLILIGDHQQLRPSAACMRLARHFNIEISLFERMIMNNVHSRRLGVQHRMRPEIAALICPHIYKDLQNHPSVENFPSVRGMTSNLFFMSHNYREQEASDTASKCNPREADLVLAMANYIMQQDYQPEDVTILAAYSGQQFYMRQQRPRYRFLSKVKITVVDNYQGEESKIILLSLVRNNQERKIGFLGTANRICVALSRAKEGFYIFGNADILKEQSELWKDIGTTLENNDSLGTTLLLHCEIHSDQYTTISEPEDFKNVPEGGCLMKCSFELPCEHRCPMICHAYDRNHASIQCKEKCARIICELGHVCPLKCVQKCRPCSVLVDKQFKCGHWNKIPCHLDPSSPEARCMKVVNEELPDCKHKVDKICYIDLKKFECPVPCPFRVESCGHECQKTCHVNNDPDHENYICHKPCARAKKGCTAELLGNRGKHQCQRKCYEACDDCAVEVNKRRSCTHTYRVQCCEDIEKKECRNNCKKVLQCGHFCKRKCFQPCGGCENTVIKTIPDCGHEIKIKCSTTPTRLDCTKTCARNLACGHVCMSDCKAPCDANNCTVLIAENFASPCGHQMKLPCNVYAKKAMLTPEDLLPYCTEPCGALLACEHICAGTCGGCLQGRIHVPCSELCHQPNICGHQCREPCKQLCPPCGQPCPVRCLHSACGNLCGQPCTPCKEPCTRVCEHGKCTRRCGEECSVPACEVACARSLPCGHPCAGLCGDPCPPVCRQCDPDNFPKDFLGYDFDEDARVIVLQDCGHILESEDMKNLMTGDQEEIAIRSCPFCRALIINTHRYKDVINKMLQTQINPIKEKVFGNAAQIKKKSSQIKENIAVFIEQYDNVLKRNGDLRQAIEELRRVTELKRKSLLQIETHEVYLNILTMTFKVLVESDQSFNGNNILIQAHLICKTLVDNSQKISQQLQIDLGYEVKRLHAMVQLDKVIKTSSYMSLKNEPPVKEAASTVFKLILGWKVFNQQAAHESLQNLEKELKINGVVSRAELDTIVKAMGFKKGHWYKCPNGHIYCIGECGGAMEVSRCNECGAQIGGTSHSLLASNVHAGEVDGSTFAAWSEQYNNMANFQF